MKKLLTATAIAAAAFTAPVTAAVVNIDLSGASSGSLITGVGGSFSQTFAGQSVAGAGISGSPTNPLKLQAAGFIDVAFWDPVVSAASNSLLSQPGNAAPLSILLGSNANSFNWTMGFGNGGGVKIDFFANNGTLVHSEFVGAGTGYNTFSLAALPTFRGITFRDNDDPAGLRFQNMSYNAVPVPEPSTWALTVLGLGLVGGTLSARRRRACEMA